MVAQALAIGVLFFVGLCIGALLTCAGLALVDAVLSWLGWDR